MRLLDRLDWGRLTAAVLRRKRFVGFSDITALHLAFQTVAPGLVTLHGPMPASCFRTITQPDAGRLRAALFADASATGAAFFAPLPGLMLHDAAAPSPRPQCTRVLGRLIGGNLALLSVRTHLYQLSCAYLGQYHAFLIRDSFACCERDVLHTAYGRRWWAPRSARAPLLRAAQAFSAWRISASPRTDWIACGSN